jgi:hypothetical protein
VQERTSQPLQVGLGQAPSHEKEATTVASFFIRCAEQEWMEVAVGARKGQKIFMAAIFAFHAGKAFVQIAAVEITIDYLLDIRPPEALLP